MVEIPPNNNPKPVTPPKVAIPNAVNNSPLNLGKLDGKKAQTDYLKQRKKLPPLTFALKYLAIISLIGLFMIHLWLKFDLDSANSYLFMAGVKKNTQVKHQELSMTNKQLNNELAELSEKIKEKKYRIKEKNFFEHQDEITKIKSQQTIQWFDEINKNGKRVLGVFDSFNRMSRFFSDPSYPDIEGGTAGIITGRQLLSRNTINVKNVTINSNSASFSVEAGSIFEKVFFLSSEFVDMMNSFDFFKNGEIFNYARKNLQGESAMSFTLKLEMQGADEEDPSDVRFKEYLDWEKSQMKKRSSIQSSRGNRASKTSTRRHRSRTKK